MKIRFCSPIRSHTGYAELGRVVLNQLLLAGHDLSAVEIAVGQSDADFGPLGRQAATLIGRSLPQPDVNIVNMIPPAFAQYRLEGARNIGFTVFEADRLPADWVAMCNAMDAIWTPSAWARRVFLESGVRVPVHVVGPDAEAHAVLVPGIAPDPGEFRILSVLEWSERKNPIGVLRAFCAAFDGDPGATLLLKAHRTYDARGNDTAVRQDVARVLGGMRAARSLPRIELATGFLSDDQMRRLYQRVHAVVGLSHAEGWGLPLWQASLLGTPVLHTGWSAPLEFLHPQGVIRCNLAPVHGMSGFADFFDIGMSWADPHLDHAVELLRSLRADWQRWRATAMGHREELRRRYGLDRRLPALDEALGG